MSQLQSESVIAIIPALIKAQTKIDHAHLDAKNPHYNSKYATLEAVIDATKNSLRDEGIVVIQSPVSENGEVILVTSLVHISGEWLRSYLPVLNEKKNCQGQGSGLTYSRRYALSSMLNIGQEDDDGETASAPKTPGEVICAFGKKHKGKAIKDIDQFELNSYCKWLSDEAKKAGKEITGDVKEFMDAAAAFLDASESRRS